MEATEEARFGQVAGFWIRLAADLIDAMVLGLFGWILVLLFPGTLARLGERGVFIGLAVSLLYSGVLQSHVGGGRTLAKRWLGLRVVRLDGSLLSIDRALVRYGMLACLVYGSAVAYALLAVVPFLPATPVISAMVGAQLALFLGCALLVPFHPLKRGLHDILAGSIVIRGGMPPVTEIERGDRPARDRKIVWAALALVAAATLASLLGFKSPGADTPAQRVHESMKQMGIQNPSVSFASRFMGGQAHTFVIASGFIRDEDTGQADALHQQIIAIIRREIPLDHIDEIGTVLRTGVNIGIYRSYKSQTRSEPAR